MDTISLASLGIVMEKLEEGVLFLDEHPMVVQILPAAKVAAWDQNCQSSCAPGVICPSAKLYRQEGLVQAGKVSENNMVRLNTVKQVQNNPVTILLQHLI